METAKPKYSEAKLFRDIVLAACPTQWLAYNQSPSSAQGGGGCFDTVWCLLSIAIFYSFVLRCSIFFSSSPTRSLSLAIPLHMREHRLRMSRIFLEVQLGRVRHDGRGDEHLHLGPRQDRARMQLALL